MAVTVGDNTVQPGTLSKAIYDALKSELDGFEPDPNDNDATLARIAAAIANGIWPHVASNADVRVTTGDAGLQRDNTMGNPATLAPSSDVLLSGALE